MKQIGCILVIVDPTAREHSAITKAALLADKLRARLELYVCDTKASREGRHLAHARGDPGHPFIRDVKALLEDLATPLRERGLDVTTETECADPLHMALIGRTQRTSAGLVVKDTHHHSLAQRTFLTNTDWQLIRSCPVPLLLTKQNAWPRVPKLCAAVDPGHTNDKPALLDNHILDYASLLTKGLGGELHVLHAYLPLAIVTAAAGAHPPMATMVSPEDLAAEGEERRAQVEKLVAGYPVRPAHIHLDVGGPVQALPRMAAEISADVIAMGAIARSGLKRAFIGSTAEDVLERLPCDALIVKPPDFAEMLPF
jgi:universal stress protein E